MKANFNWAKDMQAPDELIEKAREKHDADRDQTILQTIADEIFSDDCDDSNKLLWDYQHATEDEKAVIDATLIHLCGWSLKTLLETFLNEEVEEDEE